MVANYRKIKIQNKYNYLLMIKLLKITVYILYGLKLFSNLQPIAESSQFESVYSSIKITKIPKQIHIGF